MKILTIPNKILYREARPVDVFKPRLRTIINRMFITMYQRGGVGLAANQVGILRQIVVLNIQRSPIALINPVVHHTNHRMVSGAESCLSIPGYSGLVEREEEIFVVSRNQYGEEQNFKARGLLARCIQHEVDHLRGVLINSQEKSI